MEKYYRNSTKFVKIKKNLFRSSSKEYIISVDFLKKAYFGIQNFK